MAETQPPTASTGDFAVRLVQAYLDERAGGEDCTSAFLKAIQLYRAHRPDLPIERAGADVARILREGLAQLVEEPASAD